MISQTTSKFWKCFERLPPEIQEAAQKAYQQWQQDPYHNSLKFKHVHPTLPIYSVRVALGWRAVGLKEEDCMIWFWIGSHADYDKLISQL